MNDTQEYFTVRQVAERLGLPIQTIYCWISRGQLTAIKLHKRVLIHKDTFNTMIENAGK